ncbi:MAG TPA: alpha/beta fold hydrolase [Nitrososphaeraceae archaeon]|nr:alpha/beta fold hydrolase [Nitrososphaeraceae archaeon]
MKPLQFSHYDGKASFGKSLHLSLLFAGFLYEHVLTNKNLWLNIALVIFMINFIFISAGSKNITLVNKAFGDQGGDQNHSGERVVFTSEDGVLLVGSYYKPTIGTNDSTSTSSVILLHMLGVDRSTWDKFAQELSKNGYAVLSVDLRGHGESTKQGNHTISYQSFMPKNFKNMTLDVKAAKKYLIGEKNANPNQISIIGASIGANLALNYAASDQSINSVILLSPGLNNRGISTLDTIMKYKGPIYIVTAEDDSDSAKDSKILCEKITCAENLKIFENTTVHGTDMLSDKMVGSRLQNIILSWLDSTFEPRD